MSSTDYQREYTFEEWQRLPLETKRTIWNQYWTPSAPEIGQATRQAILNQFCRRYPAIDENAIEINCGHFGHYVFCIYVIVSDSSISVPKRFASILVNKGLVRERIDDTTVLVDWRDVGGAACKFSLHAPHPGGNG